MANKERLTKRLKKIEDWVAENEEMGGPKGYMDTFVHLYNSNINMNNQLNITNQQFNQLRSYAFEFISDKGLADEWNDFLEEKNNAVQEQETEEVPSREEAESGEEVGKENSEESEATEQEEEE